MNWDFVVLSLIYFRTASILFDLKNLNLSKLFERLTGRIHCLPVRPSSDVVLLPCRTKLQFGSTVARQEIYSDSDVVPESNQIQGLLEPRNNSPPNSPRERNLARTY